MAIRKPNPGYVDPFAERKRHEQTMRQINTKRSDIEAFDYGVDTGILDVEGSRSGDIDLVFRRIISTEEVVLPYVTTDFVVNFVIDHQKNIRQSVHETYGVINTLVSVSEAAIVGLKNYLRENGNIDQQEARIRGRNRFATPEQRAFVWVEGRGSCHYCKKPANPNARRQNEDKMHVDHKEPFNGSNTLISNMVCACKKCNIGKGRMSYEEAITAGPAVLEDNYFYKYEQFISEGKLI